MSCWAVLGINPTRNTDEIKKAYQNLIKLINFDEDDEGCKKLKTAYSKALSLATTSITDLDASLFKNSNFEVLSTIINSSLDNKDIDSTKKFVDRLNEIYASPTSRFSKESWIELLSLPILKNKDFKNSIEKELITFIYNHKFLTHDVYLLLNSFFNWTCNKELLHSKYPNCEIDVLLKEIESPLPLTYDYLSDINSEKLEDYLILREKAYLNLQNPNLENDKKYLIEAYSIYNKDLDLLKLLGSYHLNKNDNILALNYFKEAVSINSNDLYSISKIGHLLTKLNQYEKAVYYLEKYNKRLRNNIDIDSLTDLAYCYYHSYELQKSKDLYSLLLKLNPGNVSIRKIVENINIKSIKQGVESSLPSCIYRKYINPNLTPFINKLNNIYNNFTLRINENSWNELLSLPIAYDNNLFYLLEDYVIQFIVSNKNIPSNIYYLLSEHFDWNSRKKELYSYYSENFVDLLFDKLFFNVTFSYSHLTDINPEYLEDYLEYRSLSYKLMNSNSDKTEFYLNKALNLYDMDFELFKIYGEYYTNNNLYDKAIESYKTVLILKEDDYYSCCSLALLLTKIKNYKDALFYLKKSVNTAAGTMLISTEDFLSKYAICYYYTNDLDNAKIQFEALAELNSNLHYPEIYLKNINARLSGKKRKIIPIDALTNPNYISKSLISIIKNKLSLFTKK